MPDKTLSIVIPAFNEEKNIEAAVASVHELCRGRVKDYEIIIINDCSTDATASVIDRLAKENLRIKVLHNAQNRGLGYNLKTGFSMARFDYVTWFPGDNSAARDSMREAIDAIGTSDIIITYMANVRQRTFVRKTLSLLFTFLLNMIFGLKLKYYNGLSIYASSLIRPLKISAEGHDCLGEILVRLLKSGHGYIEIPFIHKIETETKSKAVSLRNLARIFKTLCILVRDVYIRRAPAG